MILETGEPWGVPDPLVCDACRKPSEQRLSMTGIVGNRRITFHFTEADRADAKEWLHLLEETLKALAGVPHTYEIAQAEAECWQFVDLLLDIINGRVPTVVEIEETSDDEAGK